MTSKGGKLFGLGIWGAAREGPWLLLSSVSPGPRPTKLSDLKQFKGPEPGTLGCVCGVRDITGLMGTPGHSWFGMVGWLGIIELFLANGGLGSREMGVSRRLALSFLS